MKIRSTVAAAKIGFIFLLVFGNAAESDELAVSERTVKAHRRRIKEKTKVQTLPQLVSIAEHLGMIAALGINAAHASL